MHLVVVESPYGGTVVERARNRAYLAACLADCYARGESPFCSHAIGPLALNDQDGIERRKGIDAGFAWSALGHLRAFYTDLGMSRGMNDALVHAAEINQPITYRALGGRWLT